MPVLLSIPEVDEALRRANAIPEDERTPTWHAIVDELLDRRSALAQAEQRIAALRVERRELDRSSRR